VKPLCYFAHRLRDADPAKQAFNLARACQRFEAFKLECATRGEVAWAPWLELAKAGVGEFRAWKVIEAAIEASSRVVLDCDGAEISEGMRDESVHAQIHGVEVEVRK